MVWSYLDQRIVQLSKEQFAQARDQSVPWQDLELAHYVLCSSFPEASGSNAAYEVQEAEIAQVSPRRVAYTLRGRLAPDIASRHSCGEYGADWFFVRPEAYQGPRK